MNSQEFWNSCSVGNCAQCNAASHLVNSLCWDCRQANAARCGYLCSIHLDRCLLGKGHKIDCLCNATGECLAGQAVNKAMLHTKAVL